MNFAEFHNSGLFFINSKIFINLFCPFRIYSDVLVKNHVYRKMKLKNINKIINGETLHQNAYKALNIKSQAKRIYEQKEKLISDDKSVGNDTLQTIHEKLQKFISKYENRADIFVEEQFSVINRNVKLYAKPDIVIVSPNELIIIDIKSFNPRSLEFYRLKLSYYEYVLSDAIKRPKIKSLIYDAKYDKFLSRIKTYNKHLIDTYIMDYTELYKRLNLTTPSSIMNMPKQYITFFSMLYHKHSKLRKSLSALCDRCDFKNICPIVNKNVNTYEIFNILDSNASQVRCVIMSI